MKYLFSILFALLVLSIGFSARGDDTLFHNPSVFQVMDIQGYYFGTAFVLNTKKGSLTITNAHVCSDAKALFARRVDPPRLEILIVKKVYDKNDLCLLTPALGLPPMNLGESYIRDTDIMVEGYPLSVHTVVFGKIGKKMGGDYRVLVHCTAQVDFGSSGSPILNSKGLVIGVLSNKCVTDECGKGTGYFVPLEYLKDFIDSQ